MSPDPRGPEYTERNRARSKVRIQALTELARRYPAEFRRIYADGLEGAGLGAPRRSGRKPEGARP